jgi:type I restriction enzyme S subunit
VDSGQFPAGWQVKKIGEVCSILTGKLNANAAVDNGKYPFFTCAREIFAIDCFAFDCEAILLAGNNAVGDFNVKHYKGKFNAYQRTYVITINQEEPLLYRYLYLHMGNALKEFKAKSVGAGTKFLKLDIIKNLTIHLPPLPEQKQIVAILDEAFEGIDRAIANTEKNLVNSRELFESYLNAVFTKKGDGWVENKMGDLLVTLTDYHANGSYEILKQNVRLLDNDGYAYMVRSTDFENNFTNPLKYIDKHAYEFLRKSKVFGGEIIISKIGNAGKVYLMPSIDRPCSLAMNLFLLRTDVNKIRSDYLYFFLESQFGKVQIAERLNGTTTKTIRKDGIRSLNILVPPLPEQKNIVDKLDSIVFETQRLETISRQKLAALNELKQSILQKAFTGELSADTAKQTTKAAQEVSAA